MKQLILGCFLFNKFGTGSPLAEWWAQPGVWLQLFIKITCKYQNHRLLCGSTFGCLAQLARASRLHREGRGFESLNIHQKSNDPCGRFIFDSCSLDENPGVRYGVDLGNVVNPNRHEWNASRFSGAAANPSTSTTLRGTLRVASQKCDKARRLRAFSMHLVHRSLGEGRMTAVWLDLSPFTPNIYPFLYNAHFYIVNGRKNPLRWRRGGIRSMTG